MKRLLALVVLLAAVAATALAQEQFDFDNPSIPAVTEALRSSAPSGGHSFSLSILGLEYNYELPIGGKWTIVFSAGAPSVVTGWQQITRTESTTIDSGTISTTHSKTNSQTTYYFGPRPDVTIEPRLYTSLERRMLKGRSTINNSSDFVSFKTRFYTTSFNDMQISIVPAYGIRRGGEHWYREYTFGLGLHTACLGILPHLGFKIGYTL
jgi:hypothetical protein